MALQIILHHGAWELRQKNRDRQSWKMALWQSVVINLKMHKEKHASVTQKTGEFFCSATVDGIVRLTDLATKYERT